MSTKMILLRGNRLQSNPPLLAYARSLSCPTRGKATYVPKTTISTPSNPPTISKPLISTSALNSALNPPATTRPPTLTLPQKDNAEPIYKYYFNLGKAFLTFYKTGIKGIYTNYTLANAIPGRPFSPLFASRGTIYAAAVANKLSRADLQLALRFHADTNVLPFFALVFLCCGEFTPFLVPFLTAIIPPSVHIPSQIRASRDKGEARRQQARAEGPPEWRNVRNIWGLKPSTLDDKLLLPLSRRMAKELALYPPWWEKLPSYMSLVTSRLKARLIELKIDDLLIAKDGGVQGMIAEEVIMACERRGLVVTGKEEAKSRMMLEQWLKEAKSDSAKELYNWLTGGQQR